MHETEFKLGAHVFEAKSPESPYFGWNAQLFFQSDEGWIMIAEAIGVEDPAVALSLVAADWSAAMRAGSQIRRDKGANAKSVLLAIPTMLTSNRIRRILVHQGQRDQARLREENKLMRELLSELAESTPCQLDHNGYCQEHELHPSPCPHARATEFLNRGEDDVD